MELCRINFLSFITILRELLVLGKFTLKRVKGRSIVSATYSYGLRQKGVYRGNKRNRKKGEKKTKQM